MITKIIRLITVSIMLAAFFCAQAFAYELPEPLKKPVEESATPVEPTDKNYVYIGRYNGLDYFLDKYSIKIKKDNSTARSWTQFIFPIGEKVPPEASRSTLQTFSTDGDNAYNSGRSKNPIAQMENEIDRAFMMKCFSVGYKNAFGENFKGITENKNVTEIVFILDRSGSMGGMEADTIGGFNSMLDKQKNAEGDAYLTTILFDNKIDILHDRLPISEIKPLTTEEYWVRGSTALLDAVGEAIKHIETIHKYARAEDRPDKVIFCITTDGMENASVKYSYRVIKNMIEAKKEMGWEFLFLGADIDSTELADRIGIGRNRAANYKKDAHGSGLMYEAFGDAVTAMRESGAVNDNWKDEVEADERKRKQRP